MTPVTRPKALDVSLVLYNIYWIPPRRSVAIPGLTGSPSLCISAGRPAVSQAFENRTVGSERVVATTTLPSQLPGRGKKPSVFVVTVSFLFAMFPSCRAAYVTHVPNIHLHDTDILLGVG